MTRYASQSSPPDLRGRVLWIVNQYAGSPAHGMEFRHYELGRELRSLGMTVVIVSGSYSHLFSRQPRVNGTYTVEEIDGLAYCWVRLPRYARSTGIRRVLNMLVFLARLYRLPIDRLPRPDAILVSSPSPFPILPAERWRRRFGSPILFEVRDIWPLSLQEVAGLSGRHPLVLLLAWFESRAYRTADRVVSVLPAAGPHFVRRGMASGKLAVIPNGISAQAIADGVPERAASSSERPAPSSGRPFVVGFVGTLGLANSLETLIEAARLLRDEAIAIEIVGHGPHEPVLRALATGLPNVHFVGAVAKAEVPRTIRGFDVAFVGFHRRPLYAFGISPNKLVDYMAAACPVILAADAANDIVRESNGGLTVPPDDPAALADAIRALRDMPADDRARLGANGRAYIARELSYHELAGRYAAVIAEAIG
jgi:glycosyltransferase involved in cell wall biosynthesis